MKALAFLLVAAAAMANDEQDARERLLRQFFEGPECRGLSDMPASSKGVDLRIGQPEPLDMGKHARRLVETGVSVREGAKIAITRVNVKDDLIEFQLGGGGFNAFWNSSGTVSPDLRRQELSREATSRTTSSARRTRSGERDLQRELDRARDIGGERSSGAARWRKRPTRSAASATATGRPGDGVALQHPLREGGSRGSRSPRTG